MYLKSFALEISSLFKGLKVLICALRKCGITSKKNKVEDDFDEGKDLEDDEEEEEEEN